MKSLTPIHRGSHYWKATSTIGISGPITSHFEATDTHGEEGSKPVLFGRDQTLESIVRPAVVDLVGYALVFQRQR